MVDCEYCTPRQLRGKADLKLRDAIVSVAQTYYADKSDDDIVVYDDAKVWRSDEGPDGGFWVEAQIYVRVRDAKDEAKRIKREAST